MAECSHENVKLLHSKLWSYVKFFKNPQWKDCRVGREQDVGSISGLSKGRYFGQEGVKTLRNTYHQKLPVCATLVTIKPFPYRIIIGRVVMKNDFFSLAVT